MSLEDDFQRTWPWLEEALTFGAYVHDGMIWPTHRKEHVWERIAGGKAKFWPGETCAFITEIYTSPTRLKSHHNWLAGGARGASLDEIKAMMPTLEQWGRDNGCHRQTGSGRRGWLGVFDGYQEMGVRKQKDLLV